MWKVGGISLELICWGSHLSLERGRKIRLRLFMSFTKRQNRHFHVVVVHCKKEMYKKAWSRAKYAFLFLCSLCRRRTLGARDFSSAVSGFCQVFIVTRAKSGFVAREFGLRPKICRPSANTENSRCTREKPLVPRAPSPSQLPKLCNVRNRDHAASKQSMLRKAEFNLPTYGIGYLQLGWTCNNVFINKVTALPPILDCKIVRIFACSNTREQ